MQKTKSAPRCYALVITALIFLFNPNINIIDPLPDFIGYFLLCRAVSRAAVAAPYFEEARIGFLRAMWVSIAKIPAFIAMITIRSGNTQDNDIVALMALCFAAVELIVLIPTITHIFSALFYLGERTEAAALIKSKTKQSREWLRSFCYLFITVKVLCCTLPEMLRLTRSVEIGSTTAIARGSRLYPFVMLGALALALIIGIVWLIHMTRYIKEIHAEGKFFSAIEALIDASGEEYYREKCRAAKKKRIFLLFNIAAILSFDIAFDGFNSIDLIPNVLSGLFLLIAIYLMREFVQGDGALALIYKIIAPIYLTLALASYIMSVIFKIKYSPSDLYATGPAAAKSLYRTVEVFAVLEFLAYIALIFLLFLVLMSYIKQNLGLKTENTRPNEHREYHGAIIRRALALCIIAALSGLSKLLQVFFSGNITGLLTGTNADFPSLVMAPMLPWFGTIVAALSAIYFVYSTYFFHMLSDEENNK